MGLPYHTHTFEVPEASAEEVSQRLQVAKFITPDKLPEFVEPGDLATVATTGDYDDLTGKPTLGTASAQDVGYFALASHTHTASAITDFSTAADARISAAIGASVQAYAANLTSWAAVAPSSYLTTAAAASAYQPIDSGLTALASFNTNGILVQTANNTFSGRTLTGTANQLTVTNGDGVSGNPTISLPSDVIIPTVLTAPNTGLHILDTNASHDLIVKPGSDLSSDRTLTITTGDADRTLTISASATVSQDYSTTGNPQFATIELGAASDTTLSRASAGKLAVEGNTVATLSEQNQALTGGATVTSLALNGGSAVTTGTLTLDLGDCPLQHYTNGGAHTLAPGSVNSSALVDITNNGSAGAITTSGWTKVAGSSFTTTNGHVFRCHCSVGNGGSLLIVQAMQ